MLRTILAILLLISAAVSAQTKAPAKPRTAKTTHAAPTAWPVESVAVEGLQHFTEDQVRRAAGIELGKPAGAKDLDAARDRLLATGAFDSVAYRYAPAPGGKGYAVTFEVAESGPRFPVRFEDLGVPDENLKDVLKRADPFFAAKIPATAPILTRYAQAIQESLGTRGTALKVVGKIEPDDQGKVGVVFRPAGARPVVARVRFTGNSVVSSADLENAVNGVAIGLPYKEVRFRQVLDAQLRPLYETRGRVRVSFPEVVTEPDKTVKGLVVSVKVDEGPAYTLGAVTFAGTGLDPSEIKKASAEFKSGVPFNREVVEAGVKKLEARVRRFGHMHLKSTVERRVDDQAKRVDLTVHVTPGPRYTFGTLKIEGLDIISEPAIRKMWGMKEGQPFNSDYPDYFLARVKEEGVFDNLGATKAALETDDQNHTVTVTLRFKGEAPKEKKKGELPDSPPPTDVPGPFSAR